ncbi:MAG: T9SS type A sorting domain-containing protein, partial [Rufibacter sp.]
FYAFENSTPAAGTINIADGFTTEEKYQAMSGGVQRENAGSESAGVDVSYIISSPIKPLAPDQKDTVAFALVLGNSKEDLLAHAQAAETKYRNLVSSRVITSVPQEMLSQEIFITPNPTNGTASVQLPERLRRSVISYHLVDATGKTVLLRERHISDNPKLELNNFPAGIYYLRLTTVDGVVTKKIMVRK